jgi:FkbM family methyltransferase
MKKYSNLSLIMALIIALPLKATVPNFLKEFISVSDLVFDVGANVGKKTIQYVQLGANVVCFEPQPGCASVLRKKFNSNVVTVEQKGLADKAGTLTLAVCKMSNGISTFSEEWRTHGRFYAMGERWNDHIEVEVVTLDAMIARYGVPAFCKIDVENFEYEVLKGLTQPIPVLSFEFAIEVVHNTKKCLNHLINLGYRKFNFAIAENNYLFFDDWVSAEELIRTIEHVSQKNALLWGDIYARYN